MPLFDHFHPPLSERRPWESFHSTWASALADALNREVLPPGYVALEQVHAGPAIEIDVAAYEEGLRPRPLPEGGLALLPPRIWTPTAAPLRLPALYPPTCTVEIVAADGGRRLVAAIELVSPANKDREIRRRLFASRCASCLSQGIGLLVVDVVTSRSGNLHNELIDLLDFDATLRMDDNSDLYCVSYRPLATACDGVIEAWPVSLDVGQALPTMPLSLAADLCLPIDLEATYMEACRRRRFEDVIP